MGQVPGHALVNDLAHRAAPVGDHRGAARHRLHDGQAERLVEVDRVQQRGRIAEDIGSAPWADRAEEDDLIPVDVRFHGVGKILLVLHDAADHQPSSRAAGDLDGVSCALVRMDAPETHQVIALGGAVREHREVDAVMDGRGVVEPGVAVGIGDRDERRARSRVGGKDAGAGEAVDGRDHRRPRVLAKCERQPVEVVMDKLELARSGQRMRDVQRLPDPAVHLGVLRVAVRADAVENRRRHRIERGEKCDIDSSRDKPLSEQAGDRLPRPVVLGRRTPGDRREHGELHRSARPDSGGLITWITLPVAAKLPVGTPAAVLDGAAGDPLRRAPPGRS